MKKYYLLIIIPLLHCLTIAIAQEKENQTSEKPVGILPVQITSFSYWIDGNNVVLYWTTATRINSLGFAIERKETSTDWTEVGFEYAIGESYVPEYFSFTDESLPAGTYNYRLKQVDLDGSYSYYHEILTVVITPQNVEIDEKNFLPQTPVLFQNYPNPFNPVTIISYQLTFLSNISLKIYDILGRELEVIEEGVKPVGFYHVQWNAHNYTSGTYFCILKINEITYSMKMLLVK